MQKKNKANFWYMLLVIVLIAFSPKSSRASNNDLLDRFLQESLMNRGFSFRTDRTVITPLTTLFFEDLKYMFQNKTTDFVSSKKEYEDEPSYEQAECLSKIQAFDNMNLEDKKAVKIYDYAIFVEDQTATSVNFAGLFSISSPDEEGWAEYRFILSPQFRGKGFGPEVMRAIYDNIIKDSIDTYVKLIKYQDYGHPNALFIPNPHNRTKVIPNPLAKAYTVDATVPFQGLQGWVHEDNQASIRMNEKCGWQRNGSKVEEDLKGHMKKHYLYRSPTL